MISGQHMILGGAAASPNGTAPRCEHLDGLPPVTPQSADCQDCRNHQDHQDHQDKPCGLPDLRLGRLFR